MASSPYEQGPFRVVLSASIAQGIRQLQRQASREGRGEEFLAAIRKLVDQLAHDPNEFGEPLYRLPGLRLRVRCAAIAPLGVHFAVHEELPFVVISSVKLMAQRDS
jgi:hypothetical protein